MLLVGAPQIWDSNALEKDDLIGAITLTELEMALVVQQCRDDEGETKPLPRWFSISTGGAGHDAGGIRAARVSSQGPRPAMRLLCTTLRV